MQPGSQVGPSVSALQPGSQWVSPNEVIQPEKGCWWDGGDTGIPGDKPVQASSEPDLAAGCSLAC